MRWPWFKKQPAALGVSAAASFPPELAVAIAVARVEFHPDRSVVEDGAFRVFVNLIGVAKFVHDDEDDTAAVIRRAFPAMSPAALRLAVALLNARVADIAMLRDLAGQRGGKSRRGWMADVRDDWGGR